MKVSIQTCLFLFHISDDLCSLTACLSYFLHQTELQSEKAAESIRSLVLLPLQQVLAEGDRYILPGKAGPRQF